MNVIKSWVREVCKTFGILEQERREILRVAVVYSSERKERDGKRFHFMLWKNSSFVLFLQKKKFVVKIFKCFSIILDARFIIIWM